MLATQPQAQILLLEALKSALNGITANSIGSNLVERLLEGVDGPRKMRELFASLGGDHQTQNSSNSEPGLVFLHIMKTAGTSFFQALKVASSDKSIWVNLDTLAVLPGEVRSAIPIIAGHIPYESRKLIGNDHIYLTILRDPRERVLSHYYEVLSIMTNEESGKAPTIEDFLWSERWNGLASNYQTRQLGYEVHLEQLGRKWTATEKFRQLGPLFPEDHPYPLSSLFDSRSVGDWNQTFESAEKALEKIDVVLTVEYMHLSTDLVNEVTGIEIQEIQHLNTRVRSRFADLPLRVRQRIDEINELDHLIWQSAQRRCLNDVGSVTRVSHPR